MRHAIILCAFAAVGGCAATEPIQIQSVSRSQDGVTAVIRYAPDFTARPGDPQWTSAMIEALSLIEAAVEHRFGAPAPLLLVYEGDKLCMRVEDDGETFSVWMVGG